MIRLRAVAIVLVCVPVLLGDGPPSAQSRSSKTWVGRHQEIENYLRLADCVSMKWFAPNYAARCTLNPGGPIAAMAWRSVVPGPPGIRQGFRENYSAELVAYELDKLLGMDMVPPTVEREIQGTQGTAQQWVEDVVDATDPTKPEGKARLHWEGELLRMTMFDMLIDNQARVPQNMLRDGAWNLILIDHSRAFGTGVARTGKLTAVDRGTWAELDATLRQAARTRKLTAVDRALWAKITALTRTQLDNALGAWLNPGQIEAILARRNLMRADVNSLTR